MSREPSCTLGLFYFTTVCPKGLQPQKPSSFPRTRSKNREEPEWHELRRIPDMDLATFAPNHIH
jgi:hypothetical protein